MINKIKIGLAQTNPIVGNLEYNFSKIMKYINDAKLKGVQLIIFPELTITGYSPQDLIVKPAFIKKNLQILDKISSEIPAGIATILGFINKEKGNIYNSAALIQKGRPIQKRYKTLLPNYDVFDEKRYFTSAKENKPLKFEFNGKSLNLGIQICEDIWDENQDIKITECQINQKADMIINLSASPFDWRKRNIRTNLIIEKSKLYKKPVILVNQIGGQDELVFDGNSVACDSRGEIIAHGDSFSESLNIFDINLENLEGEPVEFHNQSKEESIYNALILGVKDYFSKSGFSKAVLGLSGGIDSALVACIGAKALGAKNITCISMPTRFTAQMSNDDARDLAKNLGTVYQTIEIEPIINTYEKCLSTFFGDTSRDITEENIQSRIRGNILMAVANKHNWLVLSTGNKTEIGLGYCTMYGDMAGALAVIADLSKSDVYSLSRYINKISGKEIIPRRIIERPPSAELKDNQVDPFDYSVVSPLVDYIINEMKSKDELLEMGFEAELIDDIYNKIRLTEYKRKQAAPGIKISKKAFGIGRRFPIINHFKG